MIDWYESAVKYVKKTNMINQIKPDYIYSCSMPNTCHLIGYSLSKKYNIPLFMDYGDPWVYISGYSHSKLRFFIERKIEKTILDRSSLVSFSTLGCEELYKDRFNLPSQKTITIMTGFDESLLIKGNANKKNKNEAIVMTYGGVLDGQVRNPIPFFKALNDFNDENIIFNIRTDNVGYIHNLAHEYCDNKIHVDKYIPFKQYYEEMLESDILVFFGNSTKDQLPGKIFNFITTGKLIFYISNITDISQDQGIKIIENYGNAVIVHNTYDEIVRGLKKTLKMLSDNNQIDINRILQYSTRAQMQKLSAKIRELSEK